jgi:predicted nucleotidyltransferase
MVVALTLPTVAVTVKRVTSPELPGHLTPAEKAAITAFLDALRARLGAELEEVRLFGSRARGAGDEDSDVDLAVIVRAGARQRWRRVVHDLAFDAAIAHGVLLAPLVLGRDQLDDLRARELLLAADLDREGIPL